MARRRKSRPGWEYRSRLRASRGRGQDRARQHSKVVSLEAMDPSSVKAREDWLRDTSTSDIQGLDTKDSPDPFTFKEYRARFRRRGTEESRRNDMDRTARVNIASVSDNSPKARQVKADWWRNPDSGDIRSIDTRRKKPPRKRSSMGKRRSGSM